MAGTILDALASDDRGWMARAACANLQTAQFFPSDPASADEAIAVCRGCPVSAQCLDYALRHRIIDGVWGGTDGRTRTRMLGMRPNRPAA
jgi:WhiB family redox-sensing transcriptional regulator